MNCGHTAPLSESLDHDCPVKLTELEQNMMAVMIHATFCDHYCCGMTERVCQAKQLIAGLDFFGYELVKKPQTTGQTPGPEPIDPTSERVKK
jgi:hypothetical protein